MGYISNVKKMYAMTFFHSLIPAYVIERLFWQQRGMNVQMVIYCEIIYSLTVLVLEIPSGVLSDRFGRKRLLVIQAGLSAVEFAILLFANSFWMFALAVFLTGIGKALFSGSQNALLYDSLLAEGRNEEFEKLLGRISAIDCTGTILAALSGSLIAQFFNYEYNYLISLISTLAAFTVTFSLREPPMTTQPDSGFLHLRRYAGEAAAFFRSKPLVLLYCMTGAFLGACQNYLAEFWQLILQDIGIPVIFFGLFSASGFLFGIPGNLLAYKLKDNMSYKAVLSVVIFIYTTGYIMLSLTGSILCLIPMMAVSLASGFADPLIAGYLHHNVESGIRATVESFASLGLRVMTIGTGLLFGYICDRYSIFTGFGCLGALCGLYFLFFIVKRQNAVK